MIKFFRQSYAIQYVAIALLAIALWLPSFEVGSVAAATESPVTPLYNLINRILAFSPMVKMFFAFFLMLLEALIFNVILVNNQIVGKVSTMGAFVFVLLMGLTRTQADFFPFAFSVLFILLLIRVLFEIYLSQKPELDLLKAGILVALASMCYFPSILLILWVMISLSVAKKGSLRLVLIPVTGFLFAYLFYFVGMYLFGDFLSIIGGYKDYFNALHLSVSGFNLQSVILIGFLLLSSLILFLANSGFEKAIAVRVKMTTVVILLAFAIVMLFLGDNVMTNGLIFFVLAIVFAHEFSSLGNTGWVEIGLALFLLLVFANHYYFKWL